MLQDHAGLLMVTSRRFDVNGNLRGDHRPKVHRAVDNATIATQSTMGRCDPRGARAEYFSLFGELKALSTLPVSGCF